MFCVHGAAELFDLEVTDSLYVLRWLEGLCVDLTDFYPWDLGQRIGGSSGIDWLYFLYVVHI